MSLATFANEYSQLGATEQGQFAEAVRRLLADGLVWREEEADRRVYAFLLRRRELAIATCIPSCRRQPRRWPACR